MKKLILTAALALTAATSVVASPVVLETQCFKVEIEGETIVTTEKCNHQSEGVFYPAAIQYSEGIFDLTDNGDGTWSGISEDGMLTHNYRTLQSVDNAYAEYLNSAEYIYDVDNGALIFITPTIEGSGMMEFTPHFRVSVETNSVTLNTSYEGIHDATKFGYLDKWYKEDHPGLFFSMPKLYVNPLSIDLVCSHPDTFNLGMTVFNGPDGEYKGFDDFCSKAKVDIDR